MTDKDNKKKKVPDEPWEGDHNLREYRLYNLTNSIIDEIFKTKPVVYHFIYMDVVGYSKLKVYEQRDIILELSNFINKWLDEKLKYSKDKCYINTTGDGIVIGFPSNIATKQDVLKLAIDINKKFSNKVRIGLNSGDVIEFYNELKKCIDLTGPGIILAQRVMDVGDGGHVLATEGFANDIIGWEDIKTVPTSVKIKHKKEIQVYNLYCDDWGNKNTPVQKSVDLEIIGSFDKLTEYIFNIIKNKNVATIRALWCIEYPLNALDSYFRAFNALIKKKLKHNKDIRVYRLINTSYANTKISAKKHLLDKCTLELIKNQIYKIGLTNHENLEVLIINNEIAMLVSALPSLLDKNKLSHGIIIERKEVIDILIGWFDMLWGNSKQLTIDSNISERRLKEIVKNWYKHNT